MSTAVRLPATEMTTMAAKTTSPVRPKRAFARQSRECLIVRRDPSRRHQVKKHRADGDVNDGDDRQAQHQGARQRARWVAHLARDLAHVPPARERDEGPDQGGGQALEKRLGARPLRPERRQVRPVAAAEREAPDHEEAQQPELEMPPARPGHVSPARRRGC